jgi:hypothetical protein
MACFLAVRGFVFDDANLAHWLIWQTFVAEMQMKSLPAAKLKVVLVSFKTVGPLGIIRICVYRLTKDRQAIDRSIFRVYALSADSLPITPEPWSVIRDANAPTFRLYWEFPVAHLDLSLLSSLLSSVLLD